MKLSIATSRPIGKKCLNWAKKNLPKGVRLVLMEESEVFISVMYDTLISESFIKERRCYNFHPGVLPWYRGAGAYSWAIINGEFESGVTLHEIDKDIDHGDVIAIERFPITQSDTAETLFRKAEKVMFQMFQDWFAKLLKGNYKAVSQEEGRIYYRKDLDKAKDLTKYYRAFTFTGKDKAFYIKNGKKITL